MKIKNYILLGLAMMFIWFGFNSAEQHLTTFYGAHNLLPIATKALSLLYGVIIIGSFFSPTAASKLGLKLPMAIGWSLYVPFIFAVTLKNSYLTYTTGILLGLGGGLAGAAFSDFVRLEAPKGKVGETGGIINALRTIGGFSGILFTSFLISKNLIFEEIYLILGGAALIGAFLLFLVKDPSKNTEKKIQKSIPLWASLKMLIDKRVLLIFPYRASNGFLLGLVLGAIPKMIGAIHGSAYVGIITSLFHLTLSFSGYFSGKISDKIGRHKTLYGAAFSAVLTTILLINFKTLPILAFAMILAGIASATNGVVVGALNIDLFKEKIKEASVAQNILGLLFGFIPSISLVNNLSENTLFTIGFLMVLIGVASLEVLRKRYNKAV